MEVYLDLMILLNAGVDLLLLVGTNRLTGFPTQWKRAVPAAVLGGGYSGACLLRGFRFLGGWLWRMAFLGLIAMVAFGWNRSFWKRCAVFVLLTMTLGGLAVALGKPGMGALILSACGLWMLCLLGMGDGIGNREYVTVTLSRMGKSCSVVALRDSGNTLKDPVTGEPVLVVSGAVARQLTGLTQAELRVPLETLSRNPGMGLRLIPFRSVGNNAGMMLGMRFPEVLIGNQMKSVVVAFSPEGLGEGEIHEALVATG